MNKEEAIELLMSLPFEPCTCNNPTIICRCCEKVNKLREYIENLKEDEG